MTCEPACYPKSLPCAAYDGAAPPALLLVTSVLRHQIVCQPLTQPVPRTACLHQRFQPQTIRARGKVHVAERLCVQHLQLRKVLAHKVEVRRP